MIDQENEYRHMHLEAQITRKLTELYGLLSQSDRIEAEDALGHIANAQAIWLNDDGSFDLGDVDLAKIMPSITNNRNKA